MLELGAWVWVEPVVAVAQKREIVLIGPEAVAVGGRQASGDSFQNPSSTITDGF